MIPEPDLAQLQDWVDEQNQSLPDHVRDQIRYELDRTDRTATIIECRPPWNPDWGPDWTRSPVARFRYTRKLGQWSLYWVDRNSKFHEYNQVTPTPFIDELIAVVEEDPTSIFWG